MKLLLDFLRWLLGGRFGLSRRTSLPVATKWAKRRKRRPVLLTKRRRLSGSTPQSQRPKPVKSAAPPYLFGLLSSYHLPIFHTPQELADWLGVRVGALAWLVHRSTSDRRPADEQRSHYVYRWVKKRSASLEAGSPNTRPVQTQWRLIEAPKQTLKAAQRKILTEILEKIPAHQAAHGFVRGRSIVSNARPHVGQAVVIKLDLQNFYANVTYSRVVAIFRSMGYCREAAIWLGRLTTSAVPWSLVVPDGDESRSTSDGTCRREHRRPPHSRTCPPLGWMFGCPGC
ncbi:MAG: RNA-directed DNA polymerase [Planctomycetota bacterium]|nr:MAG: RNA-directed DNA polymerase [Planctomycetota bacterium]